MRLDTQRLQTLDQVREFVAGSGGLDLQPQSRADAYAFVAKTLQRFDYALLGKADKGLLRRFLGKVTGLSRARGCCASIGPRAGSATAAALRGSRSPAATPAPTAGCWPRPMRCTARCRAPSRRGRPYPSTLTWSCAHKPGK